VTGSRGLAVLRAVGPLAAAYAGIVLEEPLGAVARQRPGVLPVAMAALLGGLLLPVVRHFLIVTLTYGVALLSLKDAFRPVPLPAPLDYHFGSTMDWFRPVAFGALAALATGAAVAETRNPGSVGARRCYFAAAGIYLTGHGTFGFLRGPSWEELIMIVSGLVAFAGILFAHRVIAVESGVDPYEEDLQRQREHAHRCAERVASREWRDRTEELQKAR